MIDESRSMCLALSDDELGLLSRSILYGSPAADGDMGAAQIDILSEWVRRRSGLRLERREWVELSIAGRLIEEHHSALA